MRMYSTPKLTIHIVDSAEVRALLVHGPTVVAGTERGRLYAYDRVTGDVLWRMEDAHGSEKSDMVTSISLQGSTLLTTGWDHRVVAWVPID